MPSLPASDLVDIQVARIRELSRSGRYRDALDVAVALAVVAPHHRDVLYLIAANQRCENRIPDALKTLERLEQDHPRFSLLYQERGYCHATLRDAARAIDAFQRGVILNPALLASWTMLERLYQMTGEMTNASRAAEHVTALKKMAPEVVRAGSLASDGELSAAEQILRTYLLHAGTDIEALRLLARIERQNSLLDAAESHLEAVLRLVPHHREARLDYLRTLIDRQKYLQAYNAANSALASEPNNNEYLSLFAAACVGLGRYESAIKVYRQLIAASPGSSDLFVALGHCFKSVGRPREAIDAYQRAAASRPSFGDAYWSLANLKTYRFSDDEIIRMRAAEAAPVVNPIDRYHLCFALGRAYEDLHEYAESWHFYEHGNHLKRAEGRYASDAIEANTRKQIEICTADFLMVRAGVGAPDPDPIFIVGLPRSGSTLIEQILASHSQVHGTHELSDIQRIVVELGNRGSDRSDRHYPAALAGLAPEDFRSLGQQYIADTRAYRDDKPFFIDKMPNNFRHIGLIHLMLPNAKILDVRREPMACCFSNLKQLFASGQEFTYSVEDISRYYRTYLDLMQHWDTVLPGRILRVWYEDVVDDLDGQVRRILDFCGLEFEPACVEFYKTARSVRTASSEQVRQPIFREGLLQWRHYEPWLEPLKDGLGDAVIRYRSRPASQACKGAYRSNQNRCI
jgi:tetratricopeptide (TPR) repeat protein